MLRALLHNWWLLALRGCFALLFALAAFTVAGAHSLWLFNSINFALLTILFGLFAFISGVFTLLAAFRCFRLERGCVLLLLDGIATCLVGVFVMVLPKLTLLHLVQLIAVWAIVVAGCELGIAARLWHHLPEERFIAFGAAGSMLFGYFMLSEGVETIEGALLWLGSYALFSGSMMLLFSIRLRALRNLPHQTTERLHLLKSFTDETRSDRTLVVSSDAEFVKEKHSDR
jgi:uncharacterized membrane protein HdeD (DUF308 family)